MLFNFFEEYSTQDNLEKAKLIDFESTVFLAANSYTEYCKSREMLNSINPNLHTAYWPILPNSYWISPFSNTDDLENFIKEIFSVNKEMTILIDLELPLSKNKSLYFKNIFSFFKNKKILKDFFNKAKSHNVNIVTSEYPPFIFDIGFIYRLLGISFNVKKYKHTQCVMYYSSMIKSKIVSKLTRRGITNLRKNNPNLQLGIGTTAIGVLGNEPVLSIQSFKEDIDFMLKNNISTCIIFRLGGLNEDYLKLINSI